MSYIQVKCTCCKKEFQARQADRNRGWARFCPKRCKAIEQESRTGQYAKYLSNKTEYVEDIDYEGPGWDAHKDTF